jgi:hypothetical protein
MEASVSQNGVELLESLQGRERRLQRVVWLPKPAWVKLLTHVLSAYDFG